MNVKSMEQKTDETAPRSPETIQSEDIIPADPDPTAPMPDSLIAHMESDAQAGCCFSTIDGLRMLGEIRRLKAVIKSMEQKNQ